MKYEQLSPLQALESYADWLLAKQIDDGENGQFFYIRHIGTMKREWYMIFYVLRTLLLAGRLLNKPEYIEATFKYFDNYVDEQLPNGAFTSNYRNRPTQELSRDEYHELVRCGNLNIADNGSNTQALVQAAVMCNDPERRRRYLDAVRKWLDEWVPIWALPSGAYGNGIWGGHKLNGPYTMAVNVCSSFSSFALATGEREYVKDAERFILYQATRWLDDGRPIRMNCYPVPEENSVIEDYSRIFYLLEAMCWTHFVSEDEEVRTKIADTIKRWLFGEWGILKQWDKNTSWFRSNVPIYPLPEGMTSSRFGLRHHWELSKSNGIPHLFSYYLNHIEESAEIRERFEAGSRFLSHPLKARMNGVMSDPDEHYGLYAVESTGFAGLTLAEAIQPDCVFQSIVPQ